MSLLNTFSKYIFIDLWLNWMNFVIFFELPLLLIFGSILLPNSCALFLKSSKIFHFTLLCLQIYNVFLMPCVSFFYLFTSIDTRYYSKAIIIEFYLFCPSHCISGLSHHTVKKANKDFLHHYTYSLTPFIDSLSYKRKSPYWSK